MSSAPPATPVSDQGSFEFCFDTPSGKLAGFPLFSVNDQSRTVKVGHLMVIAELGATGEGTLKAADLEAFLQSLDLAALAKL